MLPISILLKSNNKSQKTPLDGLAVLASRLGAWLTHEPKVKILHYNINYIVTFYLQTLLGPISFFTKLTGKFLLWGRGSIWLGGPSFPFLVSKNFHDSGMEGGHGTKNKMIQWCIQVSFKLTSDWKLENLWAGRRTGEKIQLRFHTRHWKYFESIMFLSFIKKCLYLSNTKSTSWLDILLPSWSWRRESWIWKETPVDCKIGSGVSSSRDEDPSWHLRRGRMLSSVAGRILW